MQYEEPIIKIVKDQLDDVICMSPGGYGDDDGGVQTASEDDF